MKIAIVGAGLAGRVLALTLYKEDPSIKITFYDKAENLYHPICCGYTAAGMISPYAELVLNEAALYEIGQQSLKIWPKLLSVMPNASSIYQRNGTIMLAHPNDSRDFHHLSERIISHKGSHGKVNMVDMELIAKVEPMLQSNKFYKKALYIPDEANIHVPNFYNATAEFFNDQENFSYIKKECQTDAAGNLVLEGNNQYDHIFDVRGLGAKKDIEGIYGVRGESMAIYAPEVKLSHTIRLVHPRNTLYIVPRGKGYYFIGATSIQSDDYSPISLKSLLDLSSALYFVHDGFAEARVLNTFTQCRPTLLSGLPEIKAKANYISVNGFYRHGYLFTPEICRDVVSKFVIKEKDSEVVV